MMSRWRLKACPRCQGDVYVDYDADGWFEQCLQCSHRQELKHFFAFDGNKVSVMANSVKMQEDWSKSEES